MSRNGLLYNKNRGGARRRHLSFGLISPPLSPCGVFVRCCCLHTEHSKKIDSPPFPFSLYSTLVMMANGLVCFPRTTTISTIRRSCVSLLRGSGRMVGIFTKNQRRANKQQRNWAGCWVAGKSWSWVGVRGAQDGKQTKRDFAVLLCLGRSFLFFFFRLLHDLVLVERVGIFLGTGFGCSGSGSGLVRVVQGCRLQVACAGANDFPLLVFPPYPPKVSLLVGVVIVVSLFITYQPHYPTYLPTSLYFSRFSLFSCRLISSQLVSPPVWQVSFVFGFDD
ncbi:hypothetical protein HDK90DRAFT_215604 [Phyllosticta capitalensis]|uniref:Transmembrane protein n=1 Tax=Phyllosticta capitalensis TaxID=121624 RepID=A0ABR1YT65_9PEZI